MTAIPGRDLLIERVNLAFLRADPAHVTTPAMITALATVGAAVNGSGSDLDVLIRGMPQDDLRAAVVYLSRLVALGLSEKWGDDGARTIIRTHLADLAQVAPGHCSDSS